MIVEIHLNQDTQKLTNGRHLTPSVSGRQLLDYPALAALNKRDQHRHILQSFL